MDSFEETTATKWQQETLYSQQDKQHEVENEEVGKKPGWNNDEKPSNATDMSRKNWILWSRLGRVGMGDLGKQSNRKKNFNSPLLWIRRLLFSASTKRSNICPYTLVQRQTPISMVVNSLVGSYYFIACNFKTGFLSLVCHTQFRAGTMYIWLNFKNLQRKMNCAYYLLAFYSGKDFFHFQLPSIES